MGFIRKSLWVVLLLISTHVSVFGNLQKGTDSRTALFNTQMPFTVDDSLALEWLSFWSSPRFASSGNLVAYAVVDRYHERSKEEDAGRFFIPQGSHIFIRSLDEAHPFQLTEGLEYSWSPSWSPDGTELAFFGLHHDKICIGLWDRNAKRKEYYDAGSLFGRESIEWDPRNQKIFFFSNPLGWKGYVEPYENWEDPIIRESWQEVNPYDERFLSSALSQLTSFDLKDKKTKFLTPRPMVFLSRKFSPDGKNVAVLEITKDKIRVLDTTVSSLVIFPTEAGETRMIVTNSNVTRYSWSPDSRFLAYVDEGQLFIHSFAENKTMCLNKGGISITGDPLWFPDAQQVLCAAGQDFYVFKAQTGNAERLRINIPNLKQSYSLDQQGKFIYFTVVNEENGKQGIYRTSLRNHNTEELTFGDWMIQSLTLMDKHLLFTQQNSTTPENLWILNLQTREKKQISELNKHVSDFVMGKAELVSWRGKTGDPLRGVLIYPANYEKGKKYPVIFWVYETLSSDLHRFYTYIYNLQILTNEGYAVFLPDVNFETGDTSLSYIRSVEPALDRLLELGVANGNFGVMGHSFGGYATCAIITHTKRFKAAVEISGITDWVSLHGIPADYMRVSNQVGQGRMGGDLREFPERFVKNSPVFFLDRVETPLLLMNGTKDYTVPFSQAEEMYYGLRHLHKTAMLIGYPGEDHLAWETKIRVVQDMWTRILAWFEKYLK